MKRLSSLRRAHLELTIRVMVMFEWQGEGCKPTPSITDRHFDEVQYLPAF